MSGKNLSRDDIRALIVADRIQHSLVYKVSHALGGLVEGSHSPVIAMKVIGSGLVQQAAESIEVAKLGYTHGREDMHRAIESIKLQRDLSSDIFD